VEPGGAHELDRATIEVATAADQLPERRQTVLDAAHERLDGPRVLDEQERPAGVSTRRTSANAASGAGIVQSVNVTTAVSKCASAERQRFRARLMQLGGNGSAAARGRARSSM
jgi:hypothetical protein